MTVRIIAGFRRALGLHHPGRNLDVFPDDVFIVSYPKSGNTWTRFLIANLVHPEEPANFANINRLVPDPEALSKRALNRVPRPRIIKSHQYFHPRYENVIYVVRDPRDVAISEYHFHRKRRVIDDEYPQDRFVQQFVAGQTNPQYGSWGENATSWLATRCNHPRFLLLRYEDMISDTTGNLAKLASFLGLPIDSQRLVQAAERSSADQMRRLERSQSHLWTSTRETRQDLRFVREAKAGGWKTDLSPTSIAAIESAWGPLMERLGYPLASKSHYGNLDCSLPPASWEVLPNNAHPPS